LLFDMKFVFYKLNNWTPHLAPIWNHSTLQ